MGDVGAYWDNVVVERFFGSIKHDWLSKVPQPTRSHMREDVARYMKYYNVERLHSANLDQSPIEFENSFRKVFGWSSPKQLSTYYAKRKISHKTTKTLVICSHSTG
jgi:putative transposase